MCDWFNKFMAFQDITIDKLERHGFSNTVHHARKAKILKLTPYTSHRRRRINYLVVATRRSTSVTKVVGKCAAMNLKVG